MSITCRTTPATDLSVTETRWYSLCPRSCCRSWLLSSLIMTIVIGGVFSFHRSHGRPANHLQVRPGNRGNRLWIAAAHLPESQCKGRGVDLIVGLKSVHAAVARNVRPGFCENWHRDVMMPFASVVRKSQGSWLRLDNQERCA